MAGTMEQELQQYFLQLCDLEKKSLLQLLKSVTMGKTKEAGLISIEAYNNELAEAEAEYERAEYISHEEMLRQIKQW